MIACNSRVNDDFDSSAKIEMAAYLTHGQPRHIHQADLLVFCRIRMGNMILEPAAKDVRNLFRKVSAPPLLLAVSVIAEVVEAERIADGSA